MSNQIKIDSKKIISACQIAMKGLQEQRKREIKEIEEKRNKVQERIDEHNKKPWYIRLFSVGVSIYDDDLLDCEIIFSPSCDYFLEKFKLLQDLTMLASKSESIYIDFESLSFLEVFCVDIEKARGDA